MELGSPGSSEPESAHVPPPFFLVWLLAAPSACTASAPTGKLEVSQDTGAGWCALGSTSQQPRPRAAGAAAKASPFPSNYESSRARQTPVHELLGSRSSASRWAGAEPHCEVACFQPTPQPRCEREAFRLFSGISLQAAGCSAAVLKLEGLFCRWLGPRKEFRAQQV